MGMYTGLRVKLTIKEEFRPVINMLTDPELDRCWAEVAEAFPQYPFLKKWAGVERCDFIPFGTLSYMPWDSEDPEWQHAFKGGRWVFQCSLKNYGDEIDYFVETVLPHIVDVCHELYSLYEENEMPEQLLIPELEEDEEDTTLAREIATKAHAGQFRRDGVTPYITHPQAVASRLSLEGHDRETIEGGCVRWKHGSTYKLQPGYTFESLEAERGTQCGAAISGLGAVIRLYLQWLGRVVASIAKSLDFK